MTTSESVKEIFPALIAAQAAASVVPESGFNKFDKYKYSTLRDYAETTRILLSKHDLAVVTGIKEIVPLEDRPTKNDGCQHALRVILLMRIIHKSGEWIEVSAAGEAQDRGDKAVYQAITGARKYGLANAFNLATGDDPENTRKPGSGGETKKPAGANQAEWTDIRSGEVIDLAVDENFKRQLAAAYLYRQFTIHQSDQTTAYVLEQKRWSSIESIPADKRCDFLLSIKSGKLDRLKNKAAKNGKNVGV